VSGGLLTVAALQAFAATAAAPPAPDLLLVTLDTTRADAVGAYGGVGTDTPTLDALAAAGVRYASAWAPAPLTLPAHATLLTGVDPPQHGLRDNGWGRLPPDLPVLAEELRRHGYRTAAFVGSRVLDRRFGLDRGFDHYDDLATAERLGQYGAPERPAGEVVDAALAWLAAAEASASTTAAPGQQAQPPSRTAPPSAAGSGAADGPPATPPRFVWVHVYDPHAPYDPPVGAPGGEPGHPAPDERARYAAEVHYVDRELGRLLAGWPAGRQRLVAVVADHGEAFGEHGEVGHGLLLYRSALEVPLILAGPGVPARTVVPSAVATRRLPATLLALLGVTSPLPGPPLPLAGSHQPAPIFHETWFPASAYGWSPVLAVTAGHRRAVAWPRPELYDLATDPDETRDRAARANGEEREVLRELRDHLRAAVPATPAPPALDGETAAMLRSLGYLSGSGAAGDRDPRSGLPLLARFTAAAARLERADTAGAVEELRQLVAASPESVPFLARLAAALTAAGRFDEALGTLDRALRRAPAHDQVHLQRAQLLHQLGRGAEARDAYDLVLRLDPRSATAWLGRAELALREGRPAEEEELLRAGVEAGTNSGLIFARLGELELRRGRLGAADGWLEKATGLLPEWAPAWALWAEVARRQGRPELAAERRRRAAAPP
jgi:choline-sulfatase